MTSIEIDPQSRHFYNRQYFDPEVSPEKGKKGNYKAYQETFIWRMKFAVATAHIFLECASNKIPRGEKLRILDAGGAKGFLAKRLALIPRVESLNLDFSDYAISQSVCRKRTVQGDIRNLPFEDETFDILVSMDVLEHLPPEDVSRAIKETSRVLKPGGKVFTTIALPSEKLALSDKGHLTLKERIWWERNFLKERFHIDNHLTLRLARAIGSLQPKGQIFFPSLRPGLFILEKPFASIK